MRDGREMVLLTHMVFLVWEAVYSYSYLKLQLNPSTCSIVRLCAMAWHAK